MQLHIGASWFRDLIPSVQILVTGTKKIPFMSAIVAAAEDEILLPYGWPAGILGSLDMVMCFTKESPKNWPVVLFSGGLNTTRHFYNSYAQEVASRGFTVISIDHPFETDIVEFEDGTIAYGGNTNTSDLDSIYFSLDVRMNDVSFVLDTLRFEYTDGSPKAVMFGHSFGGAASAAAMMNDTRIRGGVNLDGALWGGVVNAGFDRPGINQSFILWGAGGHNTTNDANWGKFWLVLTEQGVWKRELNLREGSHGSCWDLPLIADISGIRSSLPEEVKVNLGLVGPLLGERVMNVVADYLHDYFSFVLNEKAGEGLLRGPSPDYPEVDFIG